MTTVILVISNIFIFSYKSSGFFDLWDEFAKWYYESNNALNSPDNNEKPS